MFATHYHKISKILLPLRNRVQWKKMDYKLMKFQNKERLIFLYKVVDGVCEKSFALNVARIAGLPEKIIENARKGIEGNKL